MSKGSRVHRPAVLAALLVLPGWAGAQPAPPAEWRWVTDPPAGAVTQHDVPDSASQFVTMPPGWHVTTGPGAILFRPDATAGGRFRVESEMFLFPDSGDSEYGLFLGGRDLEVAGRAYTAFVLRSDGAAAVLRVEGDRVTAEAEWAPSGSAAPRVAGQPVRNVLAVEVGEAEVTFEVNGEEVRSLPRGSLRLDGVFGFRMGEGTNVHIATLDGTRRLAPPRP